MTIYQVSRRTVPDIKKKASDVIKLANELPGTLKLKISRPTLFPRIKQKLFAFVVIRLTQKLSLTVSVLHQRALLSKETFLKEYTISEDDRRGLKSFRRLRAGSPHLFIDSTYG